MSSGAAPRPFTHALDAHFIPPNEQNMLELSEWLVRNEFCQSTFASRIIIHSLSRYPLPGAANENTQRRGKFIIIDLSVRTQIGAKAPKPVS